VDQKWISSKFDNFYGIQDISPQQTDKTYKSSDLSEQEDGYQIENLC